ncbi:MAG: efflux transporter outer membrane subunit [Methyloprofundus sp.]|nr:efflux transporter outer membrane subunit [Methyloprofundus sp.]
MSKLHGLLILCLITACAPKIEQVPLPTEIADSFSNSGTAAIQKHWWLSLNDPQLNQLIDQALAENFSLKSAYNRLEQANITAKQSGAELIPSLTATFTGSQQYSNTGDSNPFSLGLTASYEVDLWGRIRANQQAAELEALASIENVKTAELSLSSEVAITWYRLVEQRSQLDLLAKQIKTNEDNVQLLMSRFAGAQATAADLYQQQQSLEASIGERYTVNANIKVLEHLLSVLIGKTPATITIPQKNHLPDLTEQPITGLSSDLIQRRPDLRAAYFQVQSANQRVASAIADRFPKLSLTANINTSSTDLQSLFNNWIATLAGNLILPIVDGGRRVAVVDINKAKSKEALNNYATALQTAVKEVEDSLAQEQEQKQYLLSLNKQYAFSQQATKQIRLRFMYGAIDFLRVLSTQISQQSLERKQITAKRQLIEYRLKLYRALAGGWALQESTTKTDQSNG